MSEDNELRDVVLQDYKEFKGRLEALEKKFNKVENYYENALTEHERHVAEDLIEPKIAELKELSERNRIKVDELKDFRHNIAMPRIIVLEEALREDYQFKIKNLPDNPLRIHYEGLLEKLDSGGEKAEPEKEFEFQLIEKFIPPRNVKCSDCMANPVPELIEEFIVKLRKKHEEIQNSYEGIYPNLLLELIEEYEGRLKK